MFDSTKKMEDRLAVLESRVAVLEKANTQLTDLVRKYEELLSSTAKTAEKPVEKVETPVAPAEEKAKQNVVEKAVEKVTKAVKEKTAKQLEREERAAKKKALFEKRTEETVKKVMAVKGWDYDYTKQKFFEAHELTDCTPGEYYMYRLYDRTPEEQQTFYLATYQKVLQKKFGTDKEFVALLYDKERTNNYFSDYVRRPWCVNTKVTFEEFKETFKDTKRVIFKPIDGHRGYGVEAFYLEEDTIKEVYDKLATYPSGVVEEFINQHPDMSSLSPASVNTLRFVTLSNNSKPVTDDGKYVDIAYSMVRIGRGESIVDNLHSGGMVANVDLETGTLETNGADRNGKMYEFHPETGVKIKGFKIPYFEEAREMVLDAIRTRKVEGYIGWDIALGVNGPMLVEVNDRPGSDGLQTTYAQEARGMKHVMAKYL